MTLPKKSDVKIIHEIKNIGSVKILNVYHNGILQISNWTNDDVKLEIGDIVFGYERNVYGRENYKIIYYGIVNKIIIDDVLNKRNLELLLYYTSTYSYNTKINDKDDINFEIKSNISELFDNPIENFSHLISTNFSNDINLNNIIGISSFKYCPLKRIYLTNKHKDLIKEKYNISFECTTSLDLCPLDTTPNFPFVYYNCSDGKFYKSPFDMFNDYEQTRDILINK